MKLATNPFTHAIAAGKKQIGLWVSMCSPIASEVVAYSGYDWTLIDMEHSPNEYASVLHQLQSFEASGTTAIVRPEWNDPVIVKRLLDIGAQGLLFPMIQSVEEAEKAVSACRYPPNGVRGVAGSIRATKFGRIKDYVQTVEAETTIILQLETLSAMENAEEIASVDGVSGVFFGPADIAADMGLHGDPMDPAVWAAVRPVAQKLIAKGIPVGTLVLDPDFAAELLNEGFTFVACGVDTAILARGADALLATVKDNIK